MCGIVGAIGNNIDQTFLLDIFLATEPRGKEATGFWTPKHGVVKGADPAAKFLVEHREDYNKAVAESNVFIGHCRLATHGEPSYNENNHPIESKNWVLVHNGVVGITDIEDYPYVSDTDTENILAYIEEYGLEKALSFISHGASLIMVPKGEENTLFLWKTSSADMLLAYDIDNETVYICSGDKYIKAGLDNISTFEERLDGLFSHTDRRIKLTEVYGRDLWKLWIDKEGLACAEKVATLETKNNAPSNKFRETNYSWPWQHGKGIDWEDNTPFVGVGTGKHRPSVLDGTQRSTQEIKAEAKRRSDKYYETSATTLDKVASAVTAKKTNVKGTSRPDYTPWFINDFVTLIRDVNATDAIFASSAHLLKEIGEGSMFTIKKPLQNDRYACENANGDVFTIPRLLLKLAESPSCFGVGWNEHDKGCVDTCFFGLDCKDIIEAWGDDDEMPDCLGDFSNDSESCVQCWFLAACLSEQKEDTNDALAG